MHQGDGFYQFHTDWSGNGPASQFLQRKAPKVTVMYWTLVIMNFRVTFGLACSCHELLFKCQGALALIKLKFEVFHSR